MRYLIGNWKSNKTFEETYQWFDQFKTLYQPQNETQVVVAVPFPFLQEASKKIHELTLSQVALAAQDISPYPFGAYTGAVSAQMISSLVKYCIVGHSERRNYFEETHLEIANKVEQLLQANITPVLCIDAPYAQKQFAGIPPESLSKLIIAYEPIEAIGTGNPADPQQVKEVVAHIRGLLGDESVPVIYGGSTNAENAKTYLDVPGISGLLPGGSSLKADVFAAMVKAYA